MNINNNKSSSPDLSDAMSARIYDEITTCVPGSSTPGQMCAVDASNQDTEVQLVRNSAIDFTFSDTGGLATMPAPTGARPIN